MKNIISAQWQNWDGTATEDLRLEQTINGILVTSRIESNAEQRFSANYSITCDLLWRTRSFAVELDSKKTLVLTSDGSGDWSDADGPRPELHGAIDIDVPFTPFTNTLPIRRIKFDAGQSLQFTMVYITLPDLHVTLDRQEYTCIVPLSRYRYKSLDSDFVSEIEVDSDGLVMMYPGLFKRIC